ncbi:MAG: 3-isopropylmalate dehydratase small subunit [Burkholderiales bacterium]|nr:3-isopropylmalate dehydratase small subunit [Burkholderiales bacterium]
MIFEGNIHVVGDHCDTDVMIPGRYLSLVEPCEIAKHIFEEVDPGFVKRVQPGDILVAGKNFGSGSGREHAPFGLKGLGLSCIVAASFSRTFYRMAIDLGLPILTCEAAARAAKVGQRARIDTASGEIRIDRQVFRTQPMPPFIQEIIEQGGLTAWVKAEVARRRASA